MLPTPGVKVDVVNPDFVEVTGERGSLGFFQRVIKHGR